MQIELDAKVRTSDGHDAGKLRRVLVDPATLRITGFVVSTGGLLGRDGDVVGVVEEVRFDEKTAQLSGFVVKAGAGRRLVGGGETAEISADDVLRIFEGEVRVGVDREEIVPSERESGTREG